MIDSLVTVVVPTSPISSHPSTAIIRETIESIRWHFPKAPIYVLADGVRREQEAKRVDYENYLEHLLEQDIILIPQVEFVHQVEMLRRFMNAEGVPKTPYILLCEHDCPLKKEPIDWNAIRTELDAGIVNFVRFLPEPQIHPEHEHLMLGEIRTAHLLLRQTIQFSARPHIATRAFYERVLSYFSPDAKAFLEDGIYTHCVSAPWNEFKMAIYLDKDGGNSQRSYHLDGRAGERKFDETQTF